MFTQIVISKEDLIKLNLISLHSMNPKQFNTLDIEEVKKILYSSSW